MNKGYTLIELLTVIIIISILSIITIPILSKNIKQFKIDAARYSAYSLMSLTNKYYIKNELTGEVVFKCDGKVCKNDKGGKLEFDGEVPISGSIIKHIDGVEVVDLKMNGLCVVGNRTKLNISEECIDVLKPTLSLAIGKIETNSLTFGISAKSPNKIKTITYLLNGEKTVEKISNNSYYKSKVFSNLKEGTSYNLKVFIEDETGIMVEKEISAKTESLGYIKFYITRYTNTYKGEKKYVSASIKPTYVGELSISGYYIMSMRDAYSDIDGLLKDTNTKTKKIEANKWYYFESMPTISYRKYSEANTDYIYAYAIDSKKQTKTASALIPQIDPIPGFYDNEYKLLLSWENAVNKYNFAPDVDFTLSNAFSSSKNGNTAYTLKFDSSIGAKDKLKNTSVLVLPDDIEKIGAYTFARFQGLKDIKFGKNIKIIGDNAFESCIYSTEYDLVLPSKIESIGQEAFYSNTVKSIIIPSSLKEFKSSNEYIANNRGYDQHPFTRFNGAYYVDQNNPNFEDVDHKAIIDKNTKALLVSNGYIPSGTKELGVASLMYGNCSNIPSTVNKIDRYACKGSTVTNLVIPDSVVSIGEGAFQDDDMTSIKLSKKITTLPTNVFSASPITSQGCIYKLKSVTIPNNVTKISSYAFSNRCSLSSVTLPNNIKRLESGTFSGTNLSQITLPTSLEYIGDKVFEKTSIKTIEIPDSVTTLPTHMMWGNNTFEYATYKGKKYICSGSNCMNLVASE